MTKLNTGDRVPDVTVSSVNGGIFTLSSETAKQPVLLYFYPSNYGLMCRYYTVKLNDYFEDLEKLKVRMFHVNPASIDDHREWMDHVDSKYDHISDDEQRLSWMFGMIINDYKEDGTDSMTNRGFALIDKDMVIRYTWRTNIPVNVPDPMELITEIKRSLKQRP
ncbi:MAG: peroxiredoxin family protein [Methanomassiliicoccaceae archaeon]|nr:peroxiredoxin family protein [Methanomassiliicoccaceae archaeon]